MNERIKELALQAMTYVTHNPKANKRNSGDMFDEKFAELIVRECIDWCNAHARDDGTAQRIAEDIKKDFGVELDVNETLRNRSTYFGNDICTNELKNLLNRLV